MHTMQPSCYNLPNVGATRWCLPVQRVMLGERGSLQLCGDNLPGAVLTAFSQDMVGASFKFKWQRVKLEKDNTVKAKNIRDARQPRYAAYAPSPVSHAGPLFCLLPCALLRTFLQVPR